MNRTCRSAAIAAWISGITTVASAAVFDFEAEAAGPKGATLVQSSGGITMTITRLGGGPVDVAAAGFPASWGAHALSPFIDTSAGALLLTFSTAITSIRVDVGDFGPSDDDSFSLTAGGAVDSGSQDGATGFPVFHTLAVSGVNTTTAILSGGSQQYAQSLYWDNINVTAVPEPSTYALLGLGLALVGAMARRRA